MANIEQLIQREINPFDTVTFRTGNFWEEQTNWNLTVDSIHQEELSLVVTNLGLVAESHQTRTVILSGEIGSGKSYFLGRLKKGLNARAFFAYIGPWADGDRLWRHILRYTVDSLMHVPEGQTESQLLLWLKSLRALHNNSLGQQVINNRGLFILQMRSAYPTGIYQAKDFFSVLYDLINPELSHLACEWLRGDDLDESDLKLLGVSSTIYNEDAAQHILSNFGRIAADTQPIVLCFDQIDKLALNPNIAEGLQPLFTVNTTIHNEKLKNFLIIISLVKETWQKHKPHLLEADLDRLDLEIELKDISLKQAESLWEKRLAPLHKQAQPQPSTPIYPLQREQLKKQFPGGKANPRATLKLGRQLIQEYKGESTVEAGDNLAAFKLVWLQELAKIQENFTNIDNLSSADLINMLQEALTALEVKEIKRRFLPSKSFSSYSLSYETSQQQTQVGVVWVENSNLTNLYYILLSCQKAIEENMVQTMYLLRNEIMGSPNHKSYHLYQQIFKQNSAHIHLQPDPQSIYLLATYHSLINAACAGELVVGETTTNLEQLQVLIREAKVFDDCVLLQQLLNRKKPIKPLDPIQEFLLSVITTQKIMALEVLLQNANTHFIEVDRTDIEKRLQQLYRERKIRILDPNAPRQEQLVCFVS